MNWIERARLGRPAGEIRLKGLPIIAVAQLRGAAGKAVRNWKEGMRA